jgi:hypothetical protein
MEIKKGDIKFYHECGDIWKVEVLDARKENYGNTAGEAYRLKLLEIIGTTTMNPPKSGIEFEVWRAENAGGYAGWALLNH